jgi:hypothetical protein
LFFRNGRRIVDAPRVVDVPQQSTSSVRYNRRIVDDSPRIRVIDDFPRARVIDDAPRTFDRYERPVVDAPQRPSSVDTTYDRYGRPIQAAPVQADVFDRYGRPIAPAPRPATPVYYDQYGRPISDAPRYLA